MTMDRRIRAVHGSPNQGGFENDGPDDFALSSDRLYEFNFLMNQTDFEIL